MLTRRVIACLDIDAGRVVKGVGFESLRNVGEPRAFAERYERDGADEIVFLDITATIEGRAAVLDLLSRTAESVFVPLTLGGGIRSVDDASNALRAGADKVAMNSAIVARPDLLGEVAARFGAQCVVASIDAKRAGLGWEVFTHGGRRPTGLDAVEWARACVERGAGEILLTSIDKDGTRGGYDLGLTAAVAAAVSVPVVASGGAGSASDVAAVLATTGADAALVAGILHEGLTTVQMIKAELSRCAIPVRAAA